MDDDLITRALADGIAESLDAADLALVEAASKTDTEPDGDADDAEFARLKKKFMDNGMPEAAADKAARKALAAKQGGKAMSEAELYELEDRLREAVQLREAAAGNPSEFYRRLARERRLREATLTAKKRANLKSSDFAVPPDSYPIHDEAHARNALSRVEQHGSDEEKAKVRAAVKRRYPKIG